MRFNKLTPVADVDRILTINPTTVRPEWSLKEVAQAFTTQPGNHVLCVVDEAGRLLGVIRARTLFEDLVGQLAPEGMLSEVRNLARAIDVSRVLAANTARDLMTAAISVKATDPVREAFIKMYQHGLEGMPIVDEEGCLVGYLDMAELLFAWVQAEPNE